MHATANVSSRTRARRDRGGIFTGCGRSLPSRSLGTGSAPLLGMTGLWERSRPLRLPLASWRPPGVFAFSPQSAGRSRTVAVLLEEGEGAARRVTQEHHQPGVGDAGDVDGPAVRADGDRRGAGHGGDPADAVDLGPGTGRFRGARASRPWNLPECRQPAGPAPATSRSSGPLYRRRLPERRQRRRLPRRRLPRGSRRGG